MVRVLDIPQDMSELADELRLRGNRIGFVPTMGALHEGHLSLVRASVAENDVTVVSIFVNPTQFGQGEDYERYPIDLDSDIPLCEQAGADFIFTPSANDMYPEGSATFLDIGGPLTVTMCGMSRPGHFRGVATVCAKLFNIVRPHVAYFGQKDFQQLLVIRRLVIDLNIPLEISMMPIVREKGGLALSSRNRYLKPNQRKSALNIHKALGDAKQAIMNGEKDVNELLKTIGERLDRGGVQIDYVSVVDPLTLEDKTTVAGTMLLAVAGFIGNIRLIDNMLVEI